ncbi:VOC family protein [Shewanella sp. AS1]|uniref:VOC family protein n=1 Tax=Shewanella sp. AS1 TaxID=2907626 RepID=UPI001F26BB08|nr:VOC family protein [Shewanella sp. AS1]MCE9679503.1 VOC family protein [Shewanella sp. AS1]
MNKHLTINYLEIPVRDLAKTKAFFNRVFSWEFVDYGENYTCFIHAGITGGFYASEQSFNLTKGSPLIVIYSSELEFTLADIERAGGVITKAIFTFPGGRRFHFSDPNGNEYAVWSE